MGSGQVDIYKCKNHHVESLIGIISLNIGRGGFTLSKGIKRTTITNGKVFVTKINFIQLVTTVLYIRSASLGVCPNTNC